MKCQRCKEAKGRTRDHVVCKSLLRKYGRRTWILGEANVQRLCRPCHDVKERIWLEDGVLVDYRPLEERSELIEAARTFRLPTNLLRGPEHEQRRTEDQV